MQTLFISDLHLDETRPDITRAFLVFLDEQLADTASLYILGDFFESWIGDDDSSPLIDEVTAALRKTSDRGVRIFFMHGNRDFLLGEAFCARAGATLLPDPTVIELAGERTLLMHGDSLCTDDAEYMQFRSMLRSTAWQQDVLSKPLAARRELARQLRMASNEANSNKAEDIMDVNPSEVCKAIQEHSCSRLIHGHTHRPARHQVPVGATMAERIVLGDWDRGTHILVAKPDALDLIPYAFA